MLEKLLAALAAKGIDFAVAGGLAVILACLKRISMPFVRDFATGKPAACASPNFRLQI